MPQLDHLFYRGVKWGEKPLFTTQLSYKPIEKCKYDSKYQRVNRPAESRFYCSNSYQAPFYELDALPGEFLTISHWKVCKEFIVTNVGYSTTVFKKLNSVRNITLSEKEKNLIHARNFANKNIHDFFAQSFAEIVSKDVDYRYKLPVAIAEV